MAVELPHWIEVLFDGVGGAALIALVTAWNDYRRERDRTSTTKGARRPVWVYVAGGVFWVIGGVGTALHFYNKPSSAKPSIQAEPAALPPTTKEHHTDQPPTKKRVATIADEITALISEQLQIERAKIKPEDDLVLDLGATPLDEAEIVMQLETAYDIQISKSDARTFKSVADIIGYMERREHTRKAPHAP